MGGHVTAYGIAHETTSKLVSLGAGDDGDGGVWLYAPGSEKHCATLQYDNDGGILRLLTRDGARMGVSIGLTSQGGGRNRVRDRTR